MMGYVLLGHGGLDVDPRVTPPEMEIVAIPEGVTLQCYSDTGQGFFHDTADLIGRSLLHVAPWPRLGSGDVTYNLMLQSSDDPSDDALVDRLRHAGYTPVRPGRDGFPDSLRMCTGNPATCPTDPRQVAFGAGHACDGILGREDLRGDLHWLSCTGVLNADPVVIGAVLEGGPKCVALGGPRRWEPCAADLRVVEWTNRAALARAGEGDVLPYALGGPLFLLGPADGDHEHDEQYEVYVLCHERRVDGTLTVHRAGAAVHAEGVPTDRRALVRDALARLCVNEVHFT
ncbi:hypothetical protein ACFQ78_34210 [Streptomyces sp. NPDC056519]|uniref:hypothetical protein n=1 Tax=Streptomyces sp. NPDC056519 TaxID=3345849 RepID=UPI0036A052BC